MNNISTQMRASTRNESSVRCHINPRFSALQASSSLRGECCSDSCWVSFWRAQWNTDRSKVVGVVIPGGSTLGDPSSREIADLVETMRSEGVTAIFVETTQPSVLAEAVSAELGGDVDAVELYTGSLGELGSGADTVIGMLTTNAERIAQALS